jgi:hypothetical protein
MVPVSLVGLCVWFTLGVLRSKGRLMFGSPFRLVAVVLAVLVGLVAGCSTDQGEAFDVAVAATAEALRADQALMRAQQDARAIVDTDLARQEAAAEGVQGRLSDVQSAEAAKKQAIVDVEEDEADRADLLALAERQVARNARRSEIEPRISELLDAEASFQRDYLNVRGRTNQLIFMQGHRKRMRNLESFMEEIEEMDLEDDMNALTGEGDASELNKILEELGGGYTVDALSNEQLVMAVGMVSDVREGKSIQSSGDLELSNNNG